MPQLPDTLAAELERPRALSPQVVNHLLETYGLDRERIGPFLVEELPRLEDYEIDLILSPLFTPTLADQAVFAALLGRDSIPREQWPALVQQLVARPTRAALITEDRQTHSVPLRDVTIERFVHRLRLEGTIPVSLVVLLTESVPGTDRLWLQAIARRAVWESEGRCDILVRYLASAKDEYRLEDAVQLLKLAETYEPANVPELRRRIPHWQQVLRQEINEATSPKPFFNERVQELHGGGRDQRRQDDGRIRAKEAEQAFLERLERVLAL